MSPYVDTLLLWKIEQRGTTGYSEAAHEKEKNYSRLKGNASLKGISSPSA